MATIGQTADRAYGGSAAGGVLVIAEPGLAKAAAEAVAATHTRLLGCVAWSEVRDRLDQQGRAAIVLAEAEGVDTTTLDEVLPLLDHVARNADTRIIITLDASQIDLVTGVLTAPGVDLLCASTQADRVVALCIAGGEQRHFAQDVVRETEAARQRRFHEEVARIAETLARLTRDDVVPLAEGAFARRVEEPAMSYRTAPAGSGQPDIAARDIRQAIRARRLRDQHFGAGLFEDPAWDMLLDLFAAELERAQVSVSSLCIAAAVAPTTALRWIARMTEAGLFERRPDPFDRRRAFMGLSRRASAGMRAYFTALRQAGMAIA